ncbi:MAG: ABC transporter permease subunit [Pirellulaceae bacterium]|jgi:hypothetical protein|nr:ABC transporter permease subunit [Pirellulaceae bacterium]
MNAHGALAVFRFELRRTLTPSRIAVWLMLVLFPVFIVSVLKYYEDDWSQRLRPRSARRAARIQISESTRRGAVDERRAGRDRVTLVGAAAVKVEQPKRRVDAGARGAGEEDRLDLPPGLVGQLWAAVFFGLIPEVITLFGLLLWVPTLVHAELEGRTWIYLAVRPRGRVSVLLGKYLTAITWTMLAGWTSATVCAAIARPDHVLRLWATMMALVTLASLCYGALYALFGVALHRRAMVIAVGYTLVFEFLVSFIPAVINKLTVQYRLRNLLFTWMDWWELVPKEAGDIFLGTEPAWLHLLVLGAGVVGVLWLATQVVQLREYATISDT